MRSLGLKSLVPIALVVLEAGSVLSCESRELRYQMRLETSACPGSPDPLEGATWISVKIVGADLPGPIVHHETIDQPERSIRIPEIPQGGERRVEVRTYSGNPSEDDRSISFGRSRPFSVPQEMTPELAAHGVRVNIVLRRIGEFSAPRSIDDPSNCQLMHVPRAGHTATLLEDGRVLIAGGYNLSEDRLELADVEIFDPETGSFREVRKLSRSNDRSDELVGRAFHQSMLLGSGQVLIWGGERYSRDEANRPTAIDSVLTYDVPTDAYTAIDRRFLQKTPRSRHQLVKTTLGKILAVGGVANFETNTPAGILEWFDPSTNQHHLVEDQRLPRTETSATWLPALNAALIAGGVSSNGFESMPVTLAFDGDRWIYNESAAEEGIAVGDRRQAMAIVFQNGEVVAMLGGYDSLESNRATDLVDHLNVKANEIVGDPPMESRRAQACVVSISNTTAVLIGGRTSDATGALTRSDASTTEVSLEADLISTRPLAPLPRPRFDHSCTRLADGSVLVIGGMTESVDGTLEVLRDAWIYQPEVDD